VIHTLILYGAIVWYAGPYVGGPLRCGSIDGASPLYDTSHEWIAVDLDAYPAWECGDLVQVDAGGVQLMLRVKDSGPLSLYFVDTEDGLVPIVADLPFHVWEWGDALSVMGTITNATGRLRLLGAMDCTEERQEVGR